MISLDSLISVTTSLTQSASPVQNTKNLLILTGSTVINLKERYRTYTGTTAVANDFGDLGIEFAAAEEWFDQTPQPTTMLIGRWANVAAAGQLIGGALAAAAQLLANFTGIADGGFGLYLDGGAETQIAGLNFTQAVTLNGIADIIQTAIGNGTAVIWNSNYNRFEFASGTVGPNSSFGYLVPPTGQGVSDISGLLGATLVLSAVSVPGMNAESALTAATLFDAQYGGSWYALCMPQAADADHLAVGPFLEATTRKHFYGGTTADVNSLVAASTTDVIYLLSRLNLKKTMMVYSATNPVAVIGALSQLLTVDYTGTNTVITLAWKTIAGVTAENLEEAQFQALLGKNGNAVIELDNGDSVMFPGTTVSTNVYADTMVGSDNMTVDCTAAVYSGLRSMGRVAQTDAGMQYLAGLVSAVGVQYVTNGFLSTGSWNGPLFGALTAGETIPGFYVYTAPVITQSEANRAARIAVPIQVAAKLSGAVHTGSVAITLNP